MLFTFSTLYEFLLHSAPQGEFPESTTGLGYVTHHKASKVSIVQVILYFFLFKTNIKH